MHDDNASFWADIKEYEERLARDPGSFLFARLAEIYLKVGLADDALHIARNGVEQHPGYVAGQRVLALACHAKGLEDECRRALERVTQALPEDVESQKMLGRLLATQGNDAAAMGAFRIALEFNPDDVECRVELESLERRSTPPQPEAEYATTAPVAENILGDHLDRDFGAFDEESEEFEEIIEDVEILEVDEEDLLELDEAEDVSDEPAAADHDPFSTATLAGLYIQQGFIDKALDIYRAILANDPDNADVRSRIAALEARGDVPGGLTWADEELPLPPAVSSACAAPTEAKDRLMILDGWLDNIRRLKECR